MTLVFSFFFTASVSSASHSYSSASHSYFYHDNDQHTIIIVKNRILKSSLFVYLFFMFALFYFVILPDINECTNKTDNCHKNADCTNTVGSFTCACKTGYSGDGKTCTGMWIFSELFSGYTHKINTMTIRNIMPQNTDLFIGQIKYYIKYVFIWFVHIICRI